MTRARKVNNAAGYKFILEENTLLEFKNISRTKDTNPADILRCLVQNYTDERSPNKYTQTSKLKEIISCIEKVISDGKFILTSFDIPEANYALGSLSEFHDYYIPEKIKNGSNVYIGKNEFLTIRNAIDNTCVISTSAHNCIIHYDGENTKIEMSPEYIASDDIIHKQCVVKDLITTLERIDINYSFDLSKRLKYI